jgi:hypothetical protein
MSDAPKSQKRYSAKTSPFLNEVRIVLRLKHMSRLTEASYIFYILDYLRFHGKRHPREIRTQEIRPTCPIWPQQPHPKCSLVDTDLSVSPGLIG